MKNNIFIWLFGLLLIGAACGGGNSQATENEEATEEATEEQTESAAEVVESGDNYKVVILDAEPASPRKEMTGTVGNATLKVNYGSPAMKGRKLFGADGLAAYGEVWRAGANEATTIEISQNVTVGGQALAAGKYGVFAIPGEKEWTIIFNSDTDIWGTQYNEANDVLRVKAAAASMTDAREAMDFVMEGNKLVLKWGNTMVPVEIAAS